MLYLLDTGSSRRTRPWHVVDEDSMTGRNYLFALCSAVFDVRPGILTTGQVEGNHVVCSLCLRELERIGLLSPDEESMWSQAANLLRDHVDPHDVAEAMRIAQAWA